MIGSGCIVWIASAIGTKRTNRAGPMMSVVRGRPEVAGRRSNGAFDPERTFLPTGWRGAATQIGWVSPTMPAPTEAKSDGPTHPGCGPLKWQIAARLLAVY